jgi:hypothetical protein
LIVFLVAFKAMPGAKTFMPQGNWPERAAASCRFPAAPGAADRAGWPSLTHCEDFA